MALWFDGILAQTGSAAGVLVGLAYPLFDVVFIVVVVAGLAPARFRPDPSALAFVGGIVGFTVGDVVYLHQQASGMYTPGSWLEVTWVVGILLFGLAPWAPSRPPPGHTAATRRPVTRSQSQFGTDPTAWTVDRSQTTPSMAHRVAGGRVAGQRAGCVA